ncbi:MAG: hypothetical protein ACRDPA_12700 [Solirubrobacteraceae bacterium]
MALDGKPLPITAPARRTAPTPAPRKVTTTTHTTARPASAPASAGRVAHRSKARERSPTAPAVKALPSPTAADRLAVDAGILTALSLAFVGGS